MRGTSSGSRPYLRYEQRVKKAAAPLFEVTDFAAQPFGLSDGKTCKERKPHGIHPALMRMPSAPDKKSRAAALDNPEDL